MSHSQIVTAGEAGAETLQDRLYEGIVDERPLSSAFGEDASYHTTFYPNGDTEVSVAFKGFDNKVFYGRGFAFLRFGDRYDPIIGRALAFGRAVTEALSFAEAERINQVQGIYNNADATAECGECGCLDAEFREEVEEPEYFAATAAEVRLLTDIRKLAGIASGLLGDR